MIYQEPFCYAVCLHKYDPPHTEPTHKEYRFLHEQLTVNFSIYSNNLQVLLFLNQQLPVNLIQWKAVYADERHCLPTTDVHTLGKYRDLVKKGK